MAGSNGAGKSTFACSLPFGRANNPDDLQKQFWGHSLFPLYANWRAVRLVERRVARAIRERQSIVVETVLSTNKYRPYVEAAQREGIGFRFIYVSLSSANLAVRRVRERVQAGGHDVPEEKIRIRWQRSLDNLAWFASRADDLRVFLNDRNPPELLAWGNGQDFVLSDDAVARHSQTPIVECLLALPGLRRPPTPA